MKISEITHIKRGKNPTTFTDYTMQRETFNLQNFEKKHQSLKIDEKIEITKRHTTGKHR